MEKAETKAVHGGGRNTRYQAIDRDPGGNMEWKSSLEGDLAIMYDRLGRGLETQRSETFWRIRGTLYRGGAEISGNEGSFLFPLLIPFCGRTRDWSRARTPFLSLASLRRCYKSQTSLQHNRLQTKRFRAGSLSWLSDRPLQPRCAVYKCSMNGNLIFISQNPRVIPRRRGNA